MYRLLIIIFLGSVFLTSEKFVDTTNTAKFYFTVLATLFFTILLVLNKKLKSETKKLGLLITLKGLYIVGVIQAIYGILQYVGIFASNHHRFSITGSFDNPAGFSSILALLFPIGLYWCIKLITQYEMQPRIENLKKLIGLADFDNVPSNLETFTLTGGLYAIFNYKKIISA